MKTTEEKLDFKNHLFKLGQGRLVNLEDEEYWSVFWKSPDSANDVFELLTPFDIQTIRSQNKVNFLLLIYVLCNRLVEWANSNVPINHLHVLNCIRLLTKLLPCLYEMSNYKSLEAGFFLKQEYNPVDFIDIELVATPELVLGENEEVLATRLINALVKLLYFKGFTVHPNRQRKEEDVGKMVYYSVWEPGIGVTSRYQVPDLKIESHRLEVLKLIITLCGVSLYDPASQIVARGSIFLTLLVSYLPKVETLTLVCSLINVFCRAVRTSPDENMLQFNDLNLKFSRILYIHHCIQLLSLMVIYPLPHKHNLGALIPEKPYNMARVYFGKLRKDLELMFLASSLLNSLKSIININSDYSESNFGLNLRLSSSTPVWAMESMMLLWELFQCNSKFMESIGPKFYSEICFVLVFYIKQYASSVNEKNMLRLASCFLFYLSHQEQLQEQLLLVNPEFLHHLPSSMSQHQNHLITCRDFIVIQISGILGNYTSIKQLQQLNNSLLATTLVEILYNVIPILSATAGGETNDPTKKLNNLNSKGGLSFTTCTALTNLIVKFSNRDFLLREKINADLLALIIRSICIAALRDVSASRMLLFSILKSEKVYDQTWNTIYSFSNEYFDGDLLILKSIQDVEEDPKPEEVNSTMTSATNTPSNASAANLAINDENDPKLPPNFLSKFSFHGNESGSIASEESINSESQENYFDSEFKAIEEALRPVPPTGMTAKAKGKYKMGATLNKTWGGNDALRIILTILIPHLKLTLNEVWSEASSSVDTFKLVEHIGNSNINELIKDNKKLINYDFLPDSPLVPLKFQWSSIALGWYISLLFSDIYNSIDKADSATGGKNKIMKNLTSSVMSFGRLFQANTDSLTSMIETPDMVAYIASSTTKVNHWSQTCIRLFKIKAQSNGFLDVLNSKLTTVQNQAVPSTPSFQGQDLSRRLSGLRLNQVRNSSVGSGFNSPKEEPEAYFPKVTRGNSVSSFQSLNTMNRSRSNTPRNSISLT